MNLPQHIAIIPDGNRRWAKRRGLVSFLGHQKGADAAEKILETALDLKIPYITFWLCSINNLTKRNGKEVKFLHKVFGIYFRRLLKNKKIHKEGVRVRILGRWQKYLPENLKNLFEEIEAKTKDYKNFQLTFLLAYSGIDEMTTAIQRIAELRIKNSELRIDENLIKNNLWTKDLPPVDLVIRTGGEPHNSNGFMMWDTADSQFYFTETLWPDFSPEEFKKAVSIYQKIERRLGK